MRQEAVQRGTTTPNSTSNLNSLSYAQVGLVLADGYSQYSSYKHQQKMYDIAKKQAQSEAKLKSAQLKSQLNDQLAYQNVMSVVQGRSGGSSSALLQSSKKAFDDDVRMLQFMSKQTQAQYSIASLSSGAMANISLAEAIGGALTKRQADITKMKRIQ